MVNNRFSDLSSSKNIFESNKKPYNEALLHSGHEVPKNYKNCTQSKKNNKIIRRKVTYFNPSFSNSVKLKPAKN